MNKSCEAKRKFGTLRAATTFAEAYMDNIVLTFHPMRAFYCKKHQCYHIGHDRFNLEVDNNLKIDVD